MNEPVGSPLSFRVRWSLAGLLVVPTLIFVGLLGGFRLALKLLPCPDQTSTGSDSLLLMPLLDASNVSFTEQDSMSLVVPVNTSISVPLLQFSSSAVNSKLRPAGAELLATHTTVVVPVKIVLATVPVARMVSVPVPP